MLLDYHIHTKRCRHATGEMKEYLAAAVRKGLSEIGISDHFPYLAEHRAAIRLSIPLDKVAMPESELPLYVRDVENLRKRSPIPVKLGCEVDFFPGSVAAFNILSRYDFDYFIGSVHFIDGWGFDQDEYRDRRGKSGPASVYRRYLGLLALMAGTRLFDIVGHLDLPKKFGVHPPAGLDADFKAALRAVRKSGMAVEINTSGLDKPAGEAYPSEKILRMCFDLDIPVTLGSDSHHPGEVGRHFDAAVRMLRRIGYRSLASFERHILKPVRL
jgi:histidinol-phosphatase (PHP family)